VAVIVSGLTTKVVPVDLAIHGAIDTEVADRRIE
jgi:hypothetical protein